MPNYLIVSVKRFQYSVTEQKNSKIMSKVIIRPTIDIKEEPYDLYSIIVHRVIATTIRDLPPMPATTSPSPNLTINPHRNGSATTTPKSPSSKTTRK